MAPLPARTYAHTVVECKDSSVVALAENVARVSALFINDSDVVMYLMFGADAELNQGIRLNAGGGSYGLSVVEGSMITAAASCIHGGAGLKDLLVLERSNP